MYKHIVFEGTSIKALSYCGVIDELETQGHISHMTHFAGVSSGAVFALMLAIGYSAQEITDFFSPERIRGIIPNNSKLYILYNLLRYMGFYSQDCVRDALKEIIVRKFPPTLTFGELYNQTGHVLVIGVTRLVEHSGLYLNPFSYPNVSVLDAVTASICLPIFFIPRVYNFTGEKLLYVDGGVSNDFPLWIFNDDELLKQGRYTALRIGRTMSPYTLGIQASDSIYRAKNADGWLSYVKALLRTLLVQAETILNYSSSQVINVKLPYAMSSINFDINQQQKENLIRLGHTTTKCFLQDGHHINHRDNNVDAQHSIENVHSQSGTRDT